MNDAIPRYKTDATENSNVGTIGDLATQANLVLVFRVTNGLDNGQAQTPPMGFLSWERFRCNVDCQRDPDNCISEKLYRSIADVMVSDGYSDLGYVYVNIDDCWSAKSRDQQGNLQPDPDRFPSGMLNLSTYMHSRGLKLGIYGDVGTKTCGGYPGSQNFLQQDAQTFAKWGIDLLKFDGCHSSRQNLAKYYPEMSRQLNFTGRSILYSCEWASYDILNTQRMYESNKKYCNTWRNFFDIQDSWRSVRDVIFYYGIDLGNFSGVAGPGGFNDPDQLIIGDFSLSYDQEKVQFGMWAMFAAPLYISADLRTMRPQAKAILQNKGVIAINQDPRGQQASFHTKIANIQVWTKPLSLPGSYAVAFFNPEFGGTPSLVTLTLSQIELTNQNGYNITDVFDDIQIGTYKLADKLSISANPEGIVLLKIVPL
ncbi:alpha-N-acetylgalactosaminidase-like [Haliotis rubra]|uniref:alpha-N-acetylgalactosaminidase-like n=1 Tax=Haliotis rubra TaxID=36100 RepID=UPI001EE5FBCA|nr:alpha-N-acetylgalactosaminidase-like [Haliotis rubra]